MWQNKIFRYSLISILAILIIGYVVMVLAALDTYYPNTVINGVDYSFKSPAYVEQCIHEDPRDYNIEVNFRNGTEKINGHDIGLVLDYSRSLDEIKANQNPFLWFKAFWQEEYKIEKDISFSEELLDKKIDSFKEMKPENMVEPLNPTIELVDDVVVAVEHDQGSVIADPDKVHKLVKDAVAKLDKSVEIDVEGCYKPSEYNPESAAVKKCVDYCNKITSLKLVYRYADEDIALEPQQLFKLIKINEKYGTAVSKFRVTKLLESFSRLHDTFGHIRRFKTHDRATISINSDDYGWLINIEEETNELYNSIIHTRDFYRAPIFEHTAFAYVNSSNDIGDFYAEVDITNQHMYLYKNGRVVLHSDVVTGCVGLGRGTPGGLYYVYYKQSPAVLVGEDYESKVTYWMPFNGGIGFHDATWRGWFGGDIYYYSGSHGCVNMPYSAAEELYSYVEDGMPVVVY